MLKIIKQIPLILKQVDDTNHSLTVYVSTSDIDRDKEMIMPTAWKTENFAKNPVIVNSHNYDSVMNIIGRAVDFGTDSKGLWMTIKYLVSQGNPDADWAYVLAKEGMASFSVGFIENKSIPGEGEVKKVYTDIELLEVSQVVVPANPSAVQGEAKYQNAIKTFKELNMITKPEPEVTENTIRIRVEDPDKFVEDSFRTITISADKGIKAVIGKYKSDPDGPTHTQSYIFDKDKWTVEEAQSWVNERKSFETIETKAGRIISEANRTKIKETLVLLKKVQEALGELLDISEPITDSLESEEQKTMELLKSIANKFKS